MKSLFGQLAVHTGKKAVMIFRILKGQIPEILKIELLQIFMQDGNSYKQIGRVFDTTKFSDEYCKYGEFTGTMAGLACADRVKHQHYADFDFFEYIADESRNVE